MSWWPDPELLNQFETFYQECYQVTLELIKQFPSKL